METNQTIIFRSVSWAEIMRYSYQNSTAYIAVHKFKAFNIELGIWNKYDLQFVGL